MKLKNKLKTTKLKDKNLSPKNKTLFLFSYNRNLTKLELSHHIGLFFICHCLNVYFLYLY